MKKTIAADMFARNIIINNVVTRTESFIVYTARSISLRK